MSLINQMLKDLESRQTPELPNGGVMATGQTGPGRTTPRPVILILLLLVVLLGAGLAYTLWQQQSSPEAQVTNKQPVATIKQSTEPKPVEAKPSTVTAKPKATLPPLVPQQPKLVEKKAETSNQAKSPVIHSRLHRVIPAVLDGSDKERTLTIKGDALSTKHDIIVSWDGKEKVLGNTQVTWIDENTAKLKLVTGNSDRIWQVALIRPNGSRSNTVEFEVIATPTATSAQSSPTASSAIKKVIRPPSIKEQADQLYQQGYLALQQGDSASTDTQWQKALKLEPMHTKSREGLIALYLSQGRQVEASILLADGIRLHPDNPYFSMLQARVQADQGNLEAAIQTLELASATHIQNAEILAFIAALQQKQADYTKSVDSYQQALQLQPHRANWWMGLAISLEGAKKEAEAISAYKEALQRGGLNTDSLTFVKQRLEAID